MVLRITLFALLLAATLRADIVYLRDGSRYSGDLVSRSDHEVLFRVSTPDGKASALRTFRADEVVRIERTRRQPPPPPVRADDAPPARNDLSDAQIEQMLRECFELVDDDEVPAARRAVQRTLDAARPTQLPLLERIARSVRGLELADFAAEVRIQDALGGGPERLFDLKTPTRYERAALGRKLGEREAELLGKVHNGRTLVEWAGYPGDYRRLHPQAPDMVRDALLANAIIAARLQYDPRLATDRDAKAALARLRGDLTIFVAHVRALPGFTALGPPGGAAPQTPDADPTRAAAREVERRMQRAARAAVRRAELERAASQPAAAERPEGDLPSNPEDDRARTESEVPLPGAEPPGDAPPDDLEPPAADDPGAFGEGGQP